jgi:hypothetical protein
VSNKEIMELLLLLLNCALNYDMNLHLLEP